MRNLFVTFAILSLAAHGHAEAPGMQQDGAYRLGGTYMWALASDADACAMQCNAQARCQAWSFADARLGHRPACELKSSPGRLLQRPGMISGLSPRTEREGARKVVVPAETPAAGPAPAANLRPMTYRPVSEGVTVPELAGKAQAQPTAGGQATRTQAPTTGPAGYYPGRDRLSQRDGASSVQAASNAGDPQRKIPQVRARVVGTGVQTSQREYYPQSGQRRPAASQPPRQFPQE